MLKLYSFMIRVVQYGSLGLVSLAYRNYGLPYEVFHWLIQNVYAEPCQFLQSGEGSLHELYCWFILLSEGLL